MDIINKNSNNPNSIIKSKLLFSFPFKQTHNFLGKSVDPTINTINKNIFVYIIYKKSLLYKLKLPLPNSIPIYSNPSRKESKAKITQEIRTRNNVYVLDR